MNTKLMKTARTSLTSHIIEDGAGQTLCRSEPDSRWVEGDDSKVCQKCLQATATTEEPLFEVEIETPIEIEVEPTPEAPVLPFVRSSESAVVTHVIDSTGDFTFCGM